MIKKKVSGKGTQKTRATIKTPTTKSATPVRKKITRPKAELILANDPDEMEVIEEIEGDMTKVILGALAAAVAAGTVVTIVNSAKESGYKIDLSGSLKVLGFEASGSITLTPPNRKGNA